MAARAVNAIIPRGSVAQMALASSLAGKVVVSKEVCKYSKYINGKIKVGRVKYVIT